MKVHFRLLAFDSSTCSFLQYTHNTANSYPIKWVHSSNSLRPPCKNKKFSYCRGSASQQVLRKVIQGHWVWYQLKPICTFLLMN